MINAYLFNLPNETNGADKIMVQIIQEISTLTYAFLIFLFFAIVIYGSSRQRETTGRVDYPAWFFIASLIVSFLSLIFGITNGFINRDFFVIIILLTIIFAIWFFLDRRPEEI